MIKLNALPSWTWSFGGLALALMAGFLIGRISTAAPTSEDRKSTAIPPRRTFGQGGTGSENGRGSSARNRKASDGRGSHGDVADTTLATILESSSRLDRTQRLLAFLDRLPSDQFASVYADIANSPLSDVRGSERSLILQAWAERDPMSAIAFLEENGANDWERETTLSTWAAIDPQGAFAWASSSEDEGKVNNWLLGTMRGIAATSPELARDFLLQMEPGETRNRSLSSMEPFVMQYGYDFAENWLSGLGDPELLNRASRGLADNLANLDPARAGQWNAAIADTKTRRDVSETVSDRWARQDLDGAKAWVSTLPEDTRTEAAEGVARHYARANPAEGAQWLATLGDNPDLDGAKRIFISEAYRRDPEVSLDFVANISSEKSRKDYYYRYLRSWMRKDPNSARRWTTSNETILPDGVAERILR